MTAPINKRLPSQLLALVRINPPATSTIYTSALLTKLQTFGSVLEFRPVPSPIGSPSSLAGEHHPTGPTARTLYTVRFAAPTALQRALAASPLSITVSPDAQPATAAPDPYDVLQRQTRPRPRGGTFSCTVSPLADVQAQAEQQQQRLVRHRGSAALSDALLESGAPGNLVAGLALRPEYVSTESEAKERKQAPPLRLMDLYRTAAVARATRTAEQQPSSSPSRD